MPIPEQTSALIQFWIDAGEKGLWFGKNSRFDAEFREQFLVLHEQAKKNELDGWINTAESALALLLLLDQFPRNAFRGTPRMYATDAQACVIAHRILDAGIDQQLPPALRLFCYLPLSHAENLADQAKAVVYNRNLGKTYLSHALGHEEIIRKFGRFPHRNSILGRESTPQEMEFLASGGFAG